MKPCTCGRGHVCFDCLECAQPRDRFHVVRPATPTGFECQHCCQKFVAAGDAERQLVLQRREVLLIIQQLEALEEEPYFYQPYSWIDDQIAGDNESYYRIRQSEVAYAGVGDNNRSR